MSSRGSVGATAGGRVPPRLLQPVEVGGYDDVLALLPRLRAALAGDGPALLPLIGADQRASAIADALGAGQPLLRGEDDPDDPTALVVATSGSTGAPKGVLLSARQLSASAEATAQRLGGEGHWLLALPANHIAGLQVLLRAARSGTMPVVIPPGTPFTADVFTRYTGQLPRGPRYVSLVPTQLQRVLADPEARAAAAETFDAVLVGGSALATPLRRSALAAGIRIVTTYGMTETCGGCVYDGFPLPGAHVSVCAEEAVAGRPGVSAGPGPADAELVATGPGGVIELSGPMVARGYRYRADDPAFRATAHVRVFRTSDAGRLATDGSLEVLNRVDDVILSGGLNVPPKPVEDALRTLSGVQDALVVGVPDPAWGQAVAALVVLTDAAGSWTLEGLRALLAEHTALPADYRPRQMLVVPEIPQLPSGKPDRAAARRILGR